MGLHTESATQEAPKMSLVKAALIAVGAAALSLLLFTGGLGTLSFWQSQQEIPGSKISAGSVSLKGELEVQLLSRQQAGKRTYASTSTCAAPTPYVECRVVSSSLAAERLIPGDTLRVVRDVTLGGNGGNLGGNLTFNATGLLDQSAGSSAFARSAVVSMNVTKPDSSAATVGDLTSTTPVAHSQGSTFGTYTVVVTVATPPTMAGGVRWDTDLQGQTLNLGALTANFTQTN